MTHLENGGNVAVEKREFWLIKFESGRIQISYTPTTYDTEFFGPETEYQKAILPREIIHVVSMDWHEQEMARLKDALIEQNEFTASILEDMEHYFENKCCPTIDEVNQCAVADSKLRYIIAQWKVNEVQK